MADYVEALLARMNQNVYKNVVVLTASQLSHEAMAVLGCSSLASKSTIIKMLHRLLELWSGVDFRSTLQNSNRCVAWFTSPEQDRNDFMEIVLSISVNLCTGYNLEEVSNEKITRQTIAKDFIALSCITNTCTFAKLTFKKSLVTFHCNVLAMSLPPLYPPILNFLKTLEVCAFETMTKIVSFIPVRVMEDSLESRDDKLDLLDGAPNFSAHLLLRTGEVSEFLSYPVLCYVDKRRNVLNKVERTSNMDFLFFKATSLTCVCGKSIDPGSAFAILDNCYDLLCEQCARATLCNNEVERRCPVCAAPTNNWLSSHLFDKLKAKMKKRKGEFPQGGSKFKFLLDS